MVKVGRFGRHRLLSNGQELVVHVVYGIVFTGNKDVEASFVDEFPYQLLGVDAGAGRVFQYLCSTIESSRNDIDPPIATVLWPEKGMGLNIALAGNV